MQDLPYVKAQKEGETPYAFRERVYDRMCVLNRADSEQEKMRIVGKNTAITWKRVWTNLHDSETAETITAVWLVITHDFIRTNFRLHSIRLADTPFCKKCAGLDTRLYRLIECGEGMNVWERTRQRIAWIMRTTPE
jgi:hypothetical protein